ASDLIDPERRAQDVAVARASLAGPPRTLETRLVHKDGHLVDVRGTARPIVVGGVTVGSFGVARDVTQRKRAEEALRRSRKRLAQILEAASVGLCLQDAGGSIVMANAAAEEVLGRPRASSPSTRRPRRGRRPRARPWRRRTSPPSACARR